MNVQIPETKQIETGVTEIKLIIEKFTINSHEEYLYLSDILTKQKAMKKFAVDLFKDPKDKANQLHKSITGAERKVIDPIDENIYLADKKVSAWRLQQLRIQEAESEKLRKEAEAAAAKEAEELRKKQDEERLLTAQSLEKQGFTKEADAVLEQNIPAPVVVPKLVLVDKPEVAKGQTLKISYSANVSDPMTLLREIVAGRQPMAYITFNMVALNKQASLLKTELRIPGVTIVENASTSQRGA